MHLQVISRCYVQQTISVLLVLVMVRVLQCNSSSVTTGSDTVCHITDKSDGSVYYIELVDSTPQHMCEHDERVQLQIHQYQRQIADVRSTIEELKQLRDKLEAKLNRLGNEIIRARSKIQQLHDRLTTHTTPTPATVPGVPTPRGGVDIIRYECPDGYAARNDAFSSCYMFVKHDMNWFEAEMYCMGNKGHLLALESQEEQQFILELVNNATVNAAIDDAHLWLGGNDIAKEGEWIWAGMNTRFDFTNWLLYPHVTDGNIQMPDNMDGNEHCVHLFYLHEHKWNDLWCGHLHNFVCEAKILV